MQEGILKNRSTSLIVSNAQRTKNEESNLMTFTHNVVDQAEEAVKKLIEASWNVCHFSKLPDWLQDNNFLTHGHRPPLPSFRACFQSIFRLHTETVNIWTHMLGFLAFVCIATYWFLSDIKFQEKLTIGIFFIGAILCLGFSFVFHMVNCHSEVVSKAFSKLDYCGISLLIMCSSVPWLHYGFYCHFGPKVTYLTAVFVLGIATMLVSMLDKFSEPAWRSTRAGLFALFGVSSGLPAIHYIVLEGWFSRSLHWLLLMGMLYLLGALLYAVRIPERFFPGKFDIWLHSHQIFHVFVVSAALVHFHGVNELAMHRIAFGECRGL